MCVCIACILDFWLLPDNSELMKITVNKIIYELKRMVLPGFTAESSFHRTTNETHLETYSRYSKRAVGAYDQVLPMSDCWDA
jgi:hypothetical protein